MHASVADQSYDGGEQRGLATLLPERPAHQAGRMDQYEVIRSIGSGSYGQVYLVKHIIQQRNFVMKSIELNTSSPEGRDSTQQEVAVLREMRHPNIVGFWDSFFDGNDYLCIVMEHCELGDIYTYLQEAKKTRQTPEESVLLEWFVQVVLALQALHHNRILHRDLKTQNIFLTGNEATGNFALKLGDFGIARTLSNTTELAKTQIGTPFYMSPELINNKPYGVKSDIWGLGCILYEMINGQRAFDAQSLNGLALKIIKGNYTPVTSRCSQASEDLIRGLLSRNPQNRPSLKVILHSAPIRARIPNAQRSTIAAFPVENRAAVFEALTHQLSSLGIGAPGTGPRRDSLKVHEKLRRAEKRKQQEEEVLQRTIQLLQQEWLNPEAPAVSSHSMKRLDGASPAVRGSSSPGSSVEPIERANPGNHGPTRSHKREMRFQDETSSVPLPHYRSSSKMVLERRGRGSSSEASLSLGRPRARTEEATSHHHHHHVGGQEDVTGVYPHNVRPGNPFESSRPHVHNSPRSSAGRKPPSTHRAEPPKPVYGEPPPPRYYRPERSGGWRVGDIHLADRSGGVPGRSPHNVCLESLPGVPNANTVHSTVEQTMAPGRGRTISSLSEDSGSDGSLMEVEELEKWEGVSDSSDGSYHEGESHGRLQSIIDECQAAIHKHRLTIEMYQNWVQDLEAAAHEPPPAAHPSISRGGLPPLDGNDDRLVGSTRRSLVPPIIQDYAARLKRRCLEGLGTERFKMARRSLIATMEANDEPDSIRNRMVDVLGLEWIGFLSLLDQLVHLEQRWGSIVIS